MTRSDELGDFLRARRDLISPVEAGLPYHTSRRVPGLRREEVALLAGVSTDYYTRLEQGRERHPSEQVLDALARALRLDFDAAGYLFRLAQPAPRIAVSAPAQTVSPELKRLMDHFLDLPACVVNPALDVLAANPAGRQLYSGFAHLDNLLRMVFLDPAARQFYQDWDHAAHGVVGNLRALSAPFPNDSRVAQIVGELSIHSPAFVALWAKYEVRPRTSEDKHLWHPQVGGMHLHYEAFTVTSAPGQQLFAYSAEPGTPSADALVLLRGLAADATTYDSRTHSQAVAGPSRDQGRPSRGRAGNGTPPAN
jgi:transcriptional regulator with XRE-family HTH domain